MAPPPRRTALSSVLVFFVAFVLGAVGVLPTLRLRLSWSSDTDMHRAAAELWDGHGSWSTLPRWELDADAGRQQPDGTVLFTTGARCHHAGAWEPRSGAFKPGDDSMLEPCPGHGYPLRDGRRLRF